MDLVLWMSAAGLMTGAAMGLYAMIRPGWASRLVRLKADPERPGGVGEFRGTYGGLFFFTHALALAGLLAGAARLAEGPASAPAAASLAMCAMAGIIWWGTAAGRLISLFADRQGRAFNAASVAFEIVLGSLIASPLAILLTGGAA